MPVQAKLNAKTNEPQIWYLVNLFKITRLKYKVIGIIRIPILFLTLVRKRVSDEHF